MKRGVVLIAIGHPAYGKFAFNLAVSIRATSGDLPIQLVHDDKALSHLNDAQLALFDVGTPMKSQDCTLRGKTYPAMAKLKLYDYLAFDESLYLDVDAIAKKDLRPFFEVEHKYYESEVQAAAPLSTENFGIQMQWALGSTIQEHYKLQPTDVLPFINSSFQFIRKGKEAKALYKQALDNLLNPIPPSKMHATWGKRDDWHQPDELYMNIACLQKKHDPSCAQKVVYFCTRVMAAPNIADEPHYVLGLYGGANTNHRMVYSFYDQSMHKYLKELYNSMHYHKAHLLMEHKFMTNG